MRLTQPFCRQNASPSSTSKKLLWGISTALLASGFATAQTNASDVQRVHDPATIIKAADAYWTFFTGDGIKTLRSTNLTDWQLGQPVFAANPEWTAAVAPPHRDYFWAPDIIHSNDRYLLYYSVSTWGKNTSAIGLATNATLDPSDPKFEWTDTGSVVQSFATNNFNTIDPAVCFDAAGRLWMSFGSYWSGIKLIELNPQTGHRIAADSPMYSLAYNESIEAPFIHQRGPNYFLFVNWGQCCRGTNSTYEIRIGRSDKITGPYLDREGKDLRDKGGTLFLESKPPFYGPGHAGIINVAGQNWFSCHYYDGNNRGRSRLWVGKLSWDAEGWPIPPVLAYATQADSP